MADFLDSEAEQSEGERQSASPTAPRKPKKAKRLKAKGLDSDEDEEEDGEEVQDLIDDNPIEEDESDAESEGSRKRKKSDDDDDDYDDRLEDEDYDLLEENLGVKVQRKKFKRLKRIDDDDSGEDDAQVQGEERDAIANQLFEGSDNEEDQTERPPPSDAGERYASDESEGEYSGTDDFIVDDDGRPLTEVRKKRKSKFSDATIQEAQDIFGVDFDYEEFEECGDDEDEDDEADDDIYEDDEQRHARKAVKKRRKKKKFKSIHEVYEPSELERAGFTEEDDKIRKKDMPERLQLRCVPVTPATKEELDEEAEWIYNVCFSKRKPAVDPEEDPVLRTTIGSATKGPAAPSADETENWDDDCASSAAVAPSKPAPRPASTNDDEEDWDESADVVPSKPAPQPASINNNDDDEDWGESADVSPSEPAPQPASTNNDDDENWDATAAPVIIPKKEPTTVPVVPPPLCDTDDIPSIILSTVPSFTVDDKLIDAEAEGGKADEEMKQIYLPKIYNALDYMRNNLFEVPFIQFYRKEYVQPELQVDDLWEIYRWDARYCQLRTRKTRLLQLFKNMEEYQIEYMCEHPDEEQSPSMRRVSDEDFERIQAIKFLEELKDMYLLFSLYYAEDVAPMKAFLHKKKKEQARRDREAAKLARAAKSGENEDDASQREPDELPDIAEEVEEEESPIMKRKMGGGSYALCRKMGLDGLTAIFGLSPKEFAENVCDNYHRHDVQQHGENPSEAAKKYLSPRLQTVDEVLKAAKFMVATQLSREPILRQSVREIFFERATINVHPTKKGMKEIDENHSMYKMKYLKDKPIRDLKEDDFLKLTVAEEDKLIVLGIGDRIQSLSGSYYVDEVKKLYILEEFSTNVQAWNSLREDCVVFALEKLVFPVIRKELKAKLLEESKEFVLRDCAETIREWISVAPYQVNFTHEETEEFEVKKGLKVLALAYVPDYSQASFACFLTPDGNPSDYLRLQNITKNTKSFRESDRVEKEADLLAFKNFIIQKRPHVIVIGGESKDALMIQEDIGMIVQELASKETIPMISVEILDTQLAKVYAHSKKANVDFREYPPVLRQAISLGRRIQEPLVEFSQLCTHDEEILCLHLHKFQNQIPNEELLERLQMEFVNVVNSVGVDLNRVIERPYMENLLQFVCGLGPRKAKEVQKNLTTKATNKLLENRTQLVTVCHLGPIVFMNCCGFIKIDTNSLGDGTESYVEVLDGSRVHPEAYEWARKMAVDALEYDDEDTSPTAALEEILETAHKLEDLDLSAFADELLRQGFGKKRITLCDIRIELRNLYKDGRAPYKAPKMEEMFHMLTKETPQTMYPGKLITCQVVGIAYRKPQGDQLDRAEPVRNEETGLWKCAFCMKNDFADFTDVWHHFDVGGCLGEAIGVRVRLDSGISGFIPIQKLSDKQVTNPEDRVRRGQTIYCRVHKIDIVRFQVECTSRTSDLVDANDEFKLPRDRYYDYEAESRDKKAEEDAKKSGTKQTYIKRVIIHPSFKNVTFREAEKLMEQMDQGEAIVRPSSKGANHVTVTWKVAPGVCQHIDVQEERKENAFSLGQSLWIGKEEFEDLDEIIARHVHPMAGYCRDIINYKYHSNKVEGSRQKAEEFLLDEQKKNPNKIHYIMYAAKEYPGKFYLSYLPRTKVVHEFISVSPEGYRFRQQNFGNVNHLLQWFKDHYRDPPPTIPNITPYQTTYEGAETPNFRQSQESTAGHLVRSGAMTPGTEVSHRRPTPGASVPNGSGNKETAEWRRAAASLIKQASSKPVMKHVIPSGPSPRGGGNSGSQRFVNNVPVPPPSWVGESGMSSFGSRPPPKSGGPRNATEVIGDGIKKSQQMTPFSSDLKYIPTKSPGPGRQSLASTPRTNFSPRSMEESSLGDDTPLCDEN